jgi:gliding motility-associated-like protein
MKKSITLFLIFGFVHVLNSQIVINEVMVNPQTNSTNSQFQSLKMCSQSTYGSEYIELYNSSACVVDISCYLIGFNTNFGTGINGTFRFPAGTVIPGNGFLSIGGPNSGATINLFTQCSSANLSTDADRWYIPNGDGYLMLWDITGTPIDAVYWTVNANEANKWGADSDISVAPTFIAQGTTCSSISSLNGPAQLPLSSPNVFYAGQSPSIGTVIHRTVDGGSSWATSATPSINACNGACNPSTPSFQLNTTITQPTCGNTDGIITFAPLPNDTYFFNWPFPTTGTVSSADNLAAGSYQITITNLAGCTKDTTIVLTEDCPGCGLVASVSVQQNSVCEPCNYNGPSILINEINIFPNSGDGSIYGASPTGAGMGEWIELFNPNWCDSVDISGYILGSYNSTASINPGTSDGMAFVLPPGTIVPPLGFVLVRGQNATPAPTGTIDVVVGNSNNEACIDGGINNSRIWFQNSGSWFAFYDSQGVPQDAIRWSNPNAGDLNQSPCIPTNNSLPGGTTTLASFNQISGMGLTATLGASSQGMTYRRMPDGGGWSNTLAMENTSYGSCNDPANCALFSGVAQCNGTGTVNVTSGQAPFTYQWNDPLNQMTQTATNLCEGDYQVVVTDANNCQETYNISVVTNPFNLTTIIQQPGCLQNNGSITIDPYDPIYTYTWSPAVSTSNSATNLSQGTYTITIEQGFCSLDTTIVLQNPVPFESFFQIQQTTCGENNGLIIVDNTPNSSVFTYTWTPAISTTNSAADLAPGAYQVSISDNTCAFDTTIAILPSTGLTSTATIYNSTCQQANGAIDIDVSPSGTYTFTWPSGVNSSIDSAANLIAGTYLITFTDGICTGDTTILVSTTTPPTDISANITATQCNENTGIISLATTTGGISPYTYSIDNGLYSTGQVFDSLAQGSYTISVLDANNCSYQEPFTVPVFAGPTLIQVNLTNPNCGLDNGALVINGTLGGTSPYEYTVNGTIIQNQEPLLELGVGVYDLNVIDANGCAYNQLENLVMTAGESSIIIPNVLTANDDQTNDVWKVTAVCVESIECVILNRWGNEIYQFTDINGGWNGKTSDDTEAKDGVYFYKLTANYFGGGSEVFHGHITLIR